MKNNNYKYQHENSAVIDLAMLQFLPYRILPCYDSREKSKKKRI